MDASFHQLDDAKARALHLLTCPLCTNQYEDPRVLPCQHTFCCRCLTAHVSRAQSGSSTRLGAFNCPLCLADVGLPAAGAAAFPVDQRIRNIRDLMVDEMAKDLASRFKGRRHGDGACNGDGGLPDDVQHGGGRRSGARLSNITERPGGDDDDGGGGDIDSGSWSSHSAFRADPYLRSPSTDDPAFGRQRPDYSSVGSRTRRSRPDKPAKHDSDAWFETPTFRSTADATPPDADAAFSRDRLGYSSMHMPRTKRARASNKSTYDSIGRSRGRTVTSGLFGNGHSSSQTPESARKNYQRPTSMVDVSPQSSPFDNINREDDSSEPYTPKIGRNRLAYSSLREKRRQPVFDPNHLYDSPADSMEEELPSPLGSSRFSHLDGRATDNHYTGVQSRSRDTAEFGEHLRRTVSLDQNWTHFTSDRLARDQKHRETNHVRESQQARSDVQLDAEGSRTTDPKTRRQRPSLDNLTVLSNSPKNAEFRSKVSECASMSESDLSQSQRHAEYPVKSLGALNEGVAMSSMQNTASQLTSHCSDDSNKTDDVANSKHAESADSSTHVADKFSFSYSSDLSIPSSGTCTDCTAAVDQHCGSSKEAIHSPTVRSPNESCFSRLTKFRNSKNSRQSASSAASSVIEKTSKEADSASSDGDSATTSKPRARKRPPVFVGTSLNLPASHSGEDTATSPPSGNDGLKSETETKEQKSDQHFGFCTTENDDGLGADLKGEVQSGNTSDVVDSQIHDTQTFSSDVSPTAETESSSQWSSVTESADVHSFSDDVTNSQLRHDEDSAVFSAGVDSDISLRSITEPDILSPTTDVDDDDVQLNFVLDDPVSVPPGDLQTTKTDVITENNSDVDGRLTSSVADRADDTLTDLGDQELKGEVRGTVENDDAQVADGVDSSSPGHLQRNDDETVNEVDFVSNDKTSPEKDGFGFRTSRFPFQSDDDADDQCADGYMLATGVAALGDGCLVVADYGAGCVCFGDVEGHVEHRVHGFKPFSVATSATSDDDGLIYVGDRRRKTLVALDRHGADVAQWPDNQFDWICGIACLADGQLAVLDRSRTRQLGIYATSGDDDRPLMELGGHGSSLGDLCMAEFVAADSRGRVLVADSANHCVKAFDSRVPQPSVVAVYGSTRGSGDAQLQWPKGVAVDSADNVLVADFRNGRVVGFSVDGRPLGCVVAAVRGPFALCTLPASVIQRRRVAVSTFSISGHSGFQQYHYETEEIFL